MTAHTQARRCATLLASGTGPVRFQMGPDETVEHLDDDEVAAEGARIAERDAELLHRLAKHDGG